MYERNSERFMDITQPFVIADFGTADGMNSVKLFKAIIEQVRDYSPEMPIIIYLNDLPFTDLTKSSVNVQENLKEFKDLFVYANAKSFYDSIFPPNTIDFLISNLALFWLSVDLDLPGLTGMLVN